MSPSPAEEFQICWEKQLLRPPPAVPSACTALHWSYWVQTGCNLGSWLQDGCRDMEMGTWGHADRGAQPSHRREDPPLQPCSCHLPSPCPKCNRTILDNQRESGGVGISPTYPPTPPQQHSPAVSIVTNPHCSRHRCHPRCVPVGDTAWSGAG